MLCEKERRLLLPICLRNAMVSNPLGHLPGLNSYQVRTLRLSTAIPILSPLQPNSFAMLKRPFGRGCAYAYTRLQSYLNVALSFIVRLYFPDGSIYLLAYHVVFFYGVQDRGITRNYGYSLTGQRADRTFANPWAPRITSISAVNYNGLISMHLSRKHFNGRRFKRFLGNQLAPNLQPYNGVNANSVVVMGKSGKQAYVY